MQSNYTTNKSKKSFQYTQLYTHSSVSKQSGPVSQYPRNLFCRLCTSQKKKNVWDERLCHWPGSEYYHVKKSTDLHKKINCWRTSIFQAYYHTYDLKFSLILQIVIIIGSIPCCLTSVCLLIDLHLAKFQPQPSVRKQKWKKWGETEGNRKKKHKANTIQLQRIAQRSGTEYINSPWFPASGRMSGAMN